MWNSPPCRKPAVTRRQYSPWANPTFHLAPNKTKVRMSRFMTASPLPPRMLKIAVAMYSPKLSSRMMVVLKRKWGMKPPTNWEESSPETRRGATASLQYGQTRSLVVMNARQCGHMRRGSISTIIRCRGHDAGDRQADGNRGQTERFLVSHAFPQEELENVPSVPGFLRFSCPPKRLRTRRKRLGTHQSGTILIPAMVKTEREYRDDICQIGRLVFQKGWVAANDGNITIRLGAGRILATPTGVCKGMMQPDDLIIVDMKGTKISGRAQGTTEIAMHTTVYGLRPDIKAVVHAHPPVATGFATAGRQLNLALLPEVIIGLGCVPLADYGLPGTDALTEPMLPLIPKFDALLMANHGAVCYGEDVFKAYFKMETMEHFARIQLVAELLGGPKVLPRTEVDKLLYSRTRYGVKSRSAGEPNCPMSAEEAGSGSCGGTSGNLPRGDEEHFYVSRSELVQMVEEALKARGLA